MPSHLFRHLNEDRLLDGKLRAGVVEFGSCLLELPA
jgi:hypothetical protein